MIIDNHSYFYSCNSYGENVHFATKIFYKIMKSLFFAASGLVLFSTPALADPAILFGVSYNFQKENSFGLTVKGISNDLPNNVVAGVGVTYYPFSPTGQFGADVNVGYAFQNVAVIGGYDFIKNESQFSFGYVNTRPVSAGSVAAPTTGGPTPPVTPPTTLPGGAGGT
jgi:hypothetical protein